MKVLFITNCPSPYRVNFFNEMSKYCNLTVAFEMEAAKNRDSEWKSVEEYLFEAIFLKRAFTKEESAFCPKVIKYINEYKKDVIVVGGYSTPTGMYSITYMRMRHIPFILNCDGGLIKEDSYIKKCIKSFFIGSASAWLSTGKVSTEYLCHYGAEESKVFQYPFTSIKTKDIVATSVEEKIKIRKSIGIQEKYMILFVGSFIYRKGIDILLSACEGLENVAIVLVGGTDASEIVVKSEIKTQEHLYVKGFKTEKELKEYYQAADIFVLPTREDIWGLVINEAMAAGLPVITTDKCVAGLELIEQEANGYVVTSENKKQLREKIEIVLTNEKLKENIKNNNIEKIQKYTIETMAKRHIEILDIWLACNRDKV